MEAVDISEWVKLMEKIARDKYDGKLKDSDLSDEYIQKTYSELSTAAKNGYGKKWLHINEETGEPSRETVKLQQNLWKFSGAKNYAVFEQMNDLLTKNGKPTSWDEFKNGVLKLNSKYNKNYLQAEWQTAKQAAKMAANWEAYQNNADKYPNLEYRTQQDNRVRDSHHALHGIVAPINSDFWKSNYPPNGWRCRCYVVQTAAEPSKQFPFISEKEQPLEFRNNVGISGEVFKETEANKGQPHPYFALAKTADSETKKAFEYSKLAAPLNQIYKAKNGATVKQSFFADPQDLVKNIQSAMSVANNLSLSVIIRPHLYIPGTKNPELEIDGVIGDRVNLEGNIRNFVGNAFNNKLKKDGQLSELKETFILMDFGKISSLSNNEFKSIIGSTYYKMINHKSVKFLLFQYNETMIKIDRNLIPENKEEGFAYIRNTLYSMKSTKDNE